MSSDPQHSPIFTIGDTDSYLKLLADYFTQEIPPIKRGMYDNYPGGIVFQAPADARRYINENCPGKTYSVFEIDANWETDCYEQTDLFTNCYWRHLINDSPIICLVEDA